MITARDSTICRQNNNVSTHSFGDMHHNQICDMHHNHPNQDTAHTASHGKRDMQHQKKKPDPPGGVDFVGQSINAPFDGSGSMSTMTEPYGPNLYLPIQPPMHPFPVTPTATMTTAMTTMRFLQWT
jgi:hypothetical protein